MKAHVAPWKHQEVDDLAKVLASHPVIGIVNYAEIPAPALQRIRAGLRGKAVVRAGKNTLIQRAIEKADGSKPGLKELAGTLNGETMIVGTDLNPFQLFKEFKQSRTTAPARAGQTAPQDISVKKGDTPFKPGPVVGDLQKAGIPAAIENGKVVIKQDRVVAKEGETIGAELAQALAKLGIHPIEIGLDVQAVYEDGLVYQPAVLDIDEEQFHHNFQAAIFGAHALAMDRAWITTQTVEPLVAKAARQALALGIEAGYLTKETVEPILSKAYTQMLAIAKLVKGEALDEELQAALGAQTAAPAADTPAEDEKKEEPEEEEEVSEEEAAEGLGSLFD